MNELSTVLTGHLSATPGKISVLVPAHNAENTIILALKSTLRALPKSSEVLVMLDNCTDKSAERVSKISDPRLKVFTSNTQLGVARALNQLLSQSTGEFIARMDADDVCLPWRFRSQLGQMRKFKADFIFSNAILFGWGVKPFGVLPQLPVSLDSQIATLALLIANPFVHPTMLAKKSSITLLGGYAKCPAEDYDLWLRAAAAGLCMHKVRTYGLLYRVHKRQLTQQTQWKFDLARDPLVLNSLALLAKLILNKSESLTTVQEIRSAALLKAINAHDVTFLKRLTVAGLRTILTSREGTRRRN